MRKRVRQRLQPRARADFAIDLIERTEVRWLDALATFPLVPRPLQGRFPFAAGTTREQVSCRAQLRERFNILRVAETDMCRKDNQRKICAKLCNQKNNQEKSIVVLLIFKIF